MTNWDACERLAARIGEQAGDLSSEHERWRIYRLSAEIPDAWDDFAALRSRELGILESLRAGGQDVGYVGENLDSWSSWLELRVAGEVTDERILAELARSGQTRRIRSIASERLKYRPAQRMPRSGPPPSTTRR